MTASVVYCGVVYDQATNWRDLLAQPSYNGLEKDLDIQSAFGALAQALRGTPLATALGDAALDVIEHGSLREMEAVRAAGWELAPNAFDRLIALVERTPRNLPGAWIAQLYAALLSSHHQTHACPTRCRCCPSSIGRHFFPPSCSWARITRGRW